MRHYFIVLMTLFIVEFLFHPLIVFAEELQEPILDFEELVVGLRINFEDTDLVTTALKAHNNDLLVQASNFTDFDIKPEYLERAKATLNKIDYINISKLQAVDYKIDEENLILSINFPPAAMKVQNLNVWSENKDRDSDFTKGTPIKSYFLNYDLTITRSREQIYTAGVQELNYSNDGYSLNQTIFTRKNFFNQRKMTIVRLDSVWVKDIVDSTAELKIGDSITNGANWSSTTRFGGIQYATEFGLRPNLITYPLINFTGRSDIPSALDVYANSQLVYQTELRTGDFNMTSLPVVAGKGAIEVKQKDITGKLQTIVIPYYISPALLKPELVDYSFDIGSQRIGYGTLSNQYRYLVTNFDYNKGMSDKWTTGAHFESMKNIFAIGTTNLYKIGNYGVISSSIATSGPNLVKAQRLMLGYSFQGQIFSFSIQQMISGDKFLNTFNLDTSGLKNSTQGSLSFSLNQKSSIGLTYLNTFAKSNNRTSSSQMIAANYQNNLTPKSSLRVSAGTDLKNKNNAFVALSLGINLGANYVSSNVYNQDNKWTEQVGISSNFKEYTGTTYNANFSKEKDWIYDISLDKSMPKTDMTLYLFNFGNQTTQQVSFDGAVTKTPEGTFFSKAIDNSFAIAKIADFKDVGVYYNNQFVGKTSDKGIIFIPNVHSYIDSKISVNEETLPMDAQFDDTSLIINTPSKAGIIAEFNISKVHIAEMTLVDANGKPAIQDADIKIEGIDEELFVGYDGKVYIPDIKTLKQLNGSACKDDVCCHFNISVEGMENIPIIELGVQTCH